MKLLLIAWCCFLTISSLRAQNISYSGQLEAGILNGESGYPVFSVQTFHGIRFKQQQLETGLVAGVDAYSQMVLLPVMLSAKWNPYSSRPVSPVLSWGGGYGFDWLQRRTRGIDYEGGYLINPSLGIRVKTRKASKVSFSIGYKKQLATIHRSEFSIPAVDSFAPTSETVEKYKFHRISVMFGLNF